jgi:hypothetical protein
VRFASVVLALLIAGLACWTMGCDENQPYTSNDPNGSSPDLEPTITATPEPVSQEDSLLVDRVIEALVTDDPGLIAATIGYRAIGCVASASAGSPPECEGDEDAGDPVQAFYYSDCAGAYLRESEIAQAVFALTVLDVAGAYRLANKTEDGYQYAAVMVDDEGMAWEAVIDRGEVNGLLFSCSLPPEELIETRNYPIAVPTSAPTAVATPPG